MKKFFMLPILAYIILSCSKSKLDLPAPTYIPNYYPLTKGSYWIYEEYEFNENDEEVSTGVRDSVYVYGDSIVNGVKYTFINQTKNIGILNESGFYKDSSGYIIKYTDTSEVLVLPPAFSETTYTVSTENFNYEYKITSRDSVVVVPAGSYKTIDFRAHITPIAPYEASTGDFHSFYALRIGLIKKQYFIAESGSRSGFKLVRYKVNP